jgi:hypothetical protein
MLLLIVAMSATARADDIRARALHRDRRHVVAADGSSRAA